jgi:hypothetical protein
MVGAVAGAGAFFAGIYIDAWRFRRGQEILAEREKKRRVGLKEGLLMQRAAGTLSGREYERRLQELEEEAGPPAARAADGAKECRPRPQRLLFYTWPGHCGAGHFSQLPPPSLAARCERSLIAATAVAGATQTGAVVGADPCVPAAAQGLLPGPRGALCCPMRVRGRSQPAASAGARASRIS